MKTADGKGKMMGNARKRGREGTEREVETERFADRKMGTGFEAKRWGQKNKTNDQCPMDQ